MDPMGIYKRDDRQESLAFADAHPFCVLAVNGSNGPVIAHVPVVIDETGTYLIGHLARANPFCKAAQGAQGKAAAIFRGADAYVSPSYYPSKQEHGRVVPTWNYTSIEIRSDITIETQPNAMMPYIETLTDKMELGRDDPWSVSDAPDDLIPKLSRGIVGFRIQIEHITHIKKLSQDKSAKDKQGVITALETSPHASEQAVAKDMITEDN